MRCCARAMSWFGGGMRGSKSTAERLTSPYVLAVTNRLLPPAPRPAAFVGSMVSGNQIASCETVPLALGIRSIQSTARSAVKS